MSKNKRNYRLIIYTCLLTGIVSVTAACGSGDSRSASDRINMDAGSSSGKDNKNGNDGRINMDAGKPGSKDRSDKKDENSDEQEDKISLFEAGSSELMLNTDVLDQSGNEEKAGDIEAVTDVKRGDYSHTMNALGEVYYLDTYYQTIEVNDARFIKYKVEVGDKVKKGDVIMTYSFSYGKEELAAQEEAVRQKEKDYVAGLHTRQAEINQAEYDLGNLTDKDEIKIKKLEIKKLKLVLKEYTKSKKDIDEERSRLEAKKRESETKAVLAAYDGYIMELENHSKGDDLYAGNIAAVISPKKEYYVQVEDVSEGKLRYNSEVTVHVEGNPGEPEAVMQGRVISSSNILSTDNRQEFAYVKILDEPENVNWDNNIKISYTNKELKDVLLIDKDAVLYETIGAGSEIVKTPYVYIYENECAYKRYIDIFDEGGDKLVVLQGLTEGQKIVKYKKQ